MTGEQGADGWVHFDNVSHDDLISAVLALGRIIRLQARGSDMAVARKLTAQEILHSAATLTSRDADLTPFAQAVARAIASPSGPGGDRGMKRAGHLRIV